MKSKKFNVKSIKYSTLLYLIIFSIFIVVLLWGSEILLTDYLYEKYQIKDMNKIANEIYELEEDELHDYFVNVVYKNSICIEYVGEDKKSILYNDDSLGCLLGRNKKFLSRYQQDLYENEADLKAIKLVNPDYESAAMLYGIRVDNGYVYLFTMLSNINKNDTLINSQLFYMVLVVVIISIIVSIFLTKLISEPIVKITEKSKLLAKGNYNVVFEKNGIEEIDDLVDSLNYLELEVSKTDQYRRDLMANVSHDLKTPLTMIKAYAEMVRDISYKDDKKRNEHLNVIIDETDRLNILVGDILTLSKIQANEDLLDIEIFDLVDEVKSIINKFKIFCESEGYEIIVDIPDSVRVSADKKKINQVIYNLLNNAINYTGEDKKVWLSIKENKKDYLVEIKDSGKGIKEEELEHIWNKYYKNEKNHRRNKIGTGLGLSIVKGILENHKFKYGVNSVKGEGTTFYFRINKCK